MKSPMELEKLNDAAIGLTVTIAQDFREIEI